MYTYNCMAKNTLYISLSNQRCITSPHNNSFSLELPSFLYTNLIINLGTLIYNMAIFLLLKFHTQPQQRSFALFYVFSWIFLLFWHEPPIEVEQQQIKIKMWTLILQTRVSNLRKSCSSSNSGSSSSSWCTNEMKILIYRKKIFSLSNSWPFALIIVLSDCCKKTQTNIRSKKHSNSFKKISPAKSGRKNISKVFDLLLNEEINNDGCCIDAIHQIPRLLAATTSLYKVNNKEVGKGPMLLYLQEDRSVSNKIYGPWPYPTSKTVGLNLRFPDWLRKFQHPIRLDGALSSFMLRAVVLLYRKHCYLWWGRFSKTNYTLLCAIKHHGLSMELFNRRRWRLVSAQ